MGSIEISVSGVQRLDSVLRGLNKEMQSSIARNAHIKASKNLIDAARLRINFRTGNLNRSIGYEKSKETQSDINAGAIIVGPRRSKTFRGRHGHLVEFGHRVRPSKIQKYGMGLIQVRKYNSGNTSGMVKPYPFMRPALEQQRASIISAIKFYIADGVERYINRNR